MLTLLFIVLYMALFAYKATHYAKDDFVDLPTNSKSGTQKIKEFADNASQSVANSGKTAKNLMNRILAVISSMFWWSVLFGVVYLILEFGVSMYKGFSNFFSEPKTSIVNMKPSNYIHNLNTSLKEGRIVDDFYRPNRKGIFLFKANKNKKYKIKISGHLKVMYYDKYGYKHTGTYCPDGRSIIYSMKFKAGEGALLNSVFSNEAILVVKTNKQLVRKIPMTEEAVILRLPNSSVYLHVNLANKSKVIGGEWHVVVDEI